MASSSRCRDRAAQWQASMRQAAYKLALAYPAQAEAILERVEREIAAGPDFTRCRRGSFRAPKINTDRNFTHRLMRMARMIESKSYAARAKGKHGGSLGKTALRLLEVLLFVVNKKGGYLSPSYDTLARLTCMSRRAIVTAMGVLQTMGFVTIHRRIKRVSTPFGMKMVQDSNAYEYHLPKGLGALAWSIFGEKSECSKFSPREIEERKKERRLGEKGGSSAVKSPLRGPRTWGDIITAPELQAPLPAPAPRMANVE